MNIKTTSYEGKLLAVLKGTSDFKNITELIELTRLFDEPDWDRKRVATCVNRLVKKGIEIIIHNPGSPKVSYKYKTLKDMGVEPAPMKTVEDDTLLDKILDITKPIIEEKDDCDVFTCPEDTSPAPKEYVYSGMNKFTGEVQHEDVLLSVEVPISHKEITNLAQPAEELYPEPTTESLMHLIMANKPTTIKVYAVQKHYGISLADAACLMIRTSDQYDCLHVTLEELKGFAL